MPVYNEEEILEEQLRGLINFLDNGLNIDFEILVVENGSSDNTRSILTNLKEEFCCIRIIELGLANVGRAKKVGLLRATADRCFIVHADLWDQEFIEKSISLLDQYPLIQSSKNLSTANDQRGWFRRLLTVGYTACLKLLFSFEGTDTRGLKALSRNELEPIIQLCELERGMFESELVLRAQRSGLEVKELPITVKPKRETRNFMFQKISQNIVDIVKLFFVLNYNDSN